ncbi:MAG: sodium:solute symporter family protein [Pseudonocardiaceae bacterium]|nr:sodium:solute symporter family protein [Pseudonocardiaceae bacterium]
MIFAGAVSASFLLYLAIGVIAGRKVRTKSDYFVAGRRAPTLLVTGSLVASFLSTVAFMGEVGFAYDGYPILMLVLTPLNASGYVLGVLLFGRYLRRSEALTVPEFFGRRFGSRGLQAVAGVTVVIGIGAYLIAVTQGASLVISGILDIPFEVALPLIWLVYTAFTFFSGSPGVLLTDTVMFFVFVTAGVAGMGYLIWSAGGPGAAAQRLTDLPAKPGMLSWHGVLEGDAAQFGSAAEALIWAITLGIVWMTIVAVSPWQSSRYLMAKDEHTAIRSGLTAMLTMLVLYVFLMLGGAAINLFNPAVSPSETAFIWAAENVLPLGIGVLVIVGIAAAALSSASTFLSLIGFSVVHDIAPALRRGTAAAATDGGVRASRVVMLATGAVVLGITFVAPPAVLTIGYFAATLFAASWGPIAVLSIYSDRVTRRGAIFGMVSGFVVAFALQGLVEFGGLSMPVWADPVLLSFVISLLGVLVGSATERPDPAGIAFRRSLRQVPEAERSRVKLRRTSRYLLGAVPCAVLLAGLLVFLYYVPVAQS